MTWRPVATTLSVLALLAGGWTAPYTHLHRAQRDDSSGTHHGALLHSHLAADEHHHPAEVPEQDDEQDDSVVSINDFVVRGAAAPSAPVPAAVPQAVITDLRSTVWVAVLSSQPPAHGPPPGRLPASRAPPHSRPAVL